MTALSAPLLVLASTSTFRRELLARLQLPFVVASPDVDELALPGEQPVETAERLAVAKARAVAGEFHKALIIGSDQVACCGAAIYGKPGTRANARRQLAQMRGRMVVFHTAVCLLNAATGSAQCRAVPTEVVFRDFSDDEIERYLNREDALNCAGSAKAEGLGIALIGLPLIALCRMLRAEGVQLP